MSVTVRPARREDAPAAWRLLQEFAAFQAIPEAATGSAEALAALLFDRDWPRVECLIAIADGRPIGLAIFFGAVSTLRTRSMVWLEDLFVTAEHRGRGAGRALLAAVARVARERGCAFVDWAVVENNVTAFEFYRRLGASSYRDAFHHFRLEAAALDRLIG